MAIRPRDHVHRADLHHPDRVPRPSNHEVPSADLRLPTGVRRLPRAGARVLDRLPRAAREVAWPGGLVGDPSAVAFSILRHRATVTIRGESVRSRAPKRPQVSVAHLRKMAPPTTGVTSN